MDHFLLEHTFAVKKLSFGSIVNGTCFAPTFFMDPPKSGQEVFKKYLVQHKDIHNVNDNMIGLFEHYREIFTLCFPDVMSAKDDGVRKLPERERIISLRLPYNGIRRLIVTEEEDNGVRSAILTFHFKYPPQVIINEYGADKFDGGKIKFRPPARYLTWNRRLNIDETLAHASCFTLDLTSLDADLFLDCLGRMRKSIGPAMEFRCLERIKPIFFKNYRPNFLGNTSLIPQEFSKLKEPEYFPLAYAVEAITSRGGEVYDYFFRPGFENFKAFLKMVLNTFDDDLVNEPDAKVAKTVFALEVLLQEIDQLNDMPDLLTYYMALYNSPDKVTAVIQKKRASNWNNQGYILVRKLIITPSRKIFVNPELIMGNRFLRKHGPERMVRILFRDDDGTKLSFMTKKNIVADCVKKALIEGVTIAGKQYVMVGSSCSQLRDNGCYFVQGTVADADDLRRSMGRFKIEPVPKMMARIGQCFTQSKLSRVRIERNAYRKVPDFEGGANSQGKAYCFSDGVGDISASFAARIAHDLHFNGSVPSCYQFRFRGFKGVLSVSPLLDRINAWKDINEIDKEKARLEMELRPSQEKFKGPREDYIEIVKHAAPSLVSLNKPMLNIMDQVSKTQSPTGHDRISKHVFYLLNRHTNNIMGALNTEKDAMMLMAGFPKLIMYDRLTNFCVTQEPFFRSMLRSCARSLLSKLTKKMNIAIPPSLGRSMFGIVDETGLLQSGQVFVRYTVDCFEKLPKECAQKRIHLGKVLITKNPAIVSGDVRIFEAVDIPALRYLTDVVVFPRYGPRPHTDEMAGSDLDGDEYTVIWDPSLLLEFNEPAFDYSVAAQRPEDIATVTDEDNFQNFMAEFFVNYISQDSIGQLANAHLANSDLYGINTEHCNRIALKHNQSVDFPKTGIAPPRLTRDWNDDCPPERVERWPDFMAKKSKLSYRSRNLMGHLYRSIVDIETVLNLADSYASVDAAPSCDIAFQIEEDVLDELAMEHYEFVETQYDQYAAQIQNVLDTYGIANEGELFSGHYSSVKGKITDSGENDDLSLFNTSGVVQHRLEEIVATFRTQFFEYFENGLDYLETNEKKQGSNQSAAILDQICTQPTSKMCYVAKFYYMHAYASASTHFLSFPWLLWDVLAYIKQTYIVQNGIKLPIDPLGERLTDHIASVLDTTDEEVMGLIEGLKKQLYEASGAEVFHLYFRCHKGLYDLLLFYGLWAQLHSMEISFLDLCALSICFSNGDLTPDIEDYYPWLESIEVILDGSHETDLYVTLGGLGRRFVILLSAFSSNKLRTFPHLDITLGNYHCSISQEKLSSLRSAALTTYYHLSLTGTKAVLPQPTIIEQDNGFPVIESLPFMIEIATSVPLDQCLVALKQRAAETGCCYIATRALTNLHGPTIRIYVVAKGTLQQINRFQDHLAVTPGDFPSARELYDDMVRQVSKKLFSPFGTNV